MRLLFTIEKKILAYASEYKTNLIEFPKFGFNGQILVQIKYMRKFSQFPTKDCQVILTSTREICGTRFRNTYIWVPGGRRGAKGWSWTGARRFGRMKSFLKPSLP